MFPVIKDGGFQKLRFAFGIVSERMFLSETLPADVAVCDGRAAADLADDAPFSFAGFVIPLQCLRVIAFPAKMFTSALFRHCRSAADAANAREIARSRECEVAR